MIKSGSVVAAAAAEPLERRWKKQMEKAQERIRVSCFCYKMEWLLIGVRHVLIVIGKDTDKGGDGWNNDTNY